jgi:hypothetical protein
MSSIQGFQQSSSGPLPLQGQAGRNGPWVNRKPGAGFVQAGQSGPAVGPNDQNGRDSGGPYKRSIGCGSGVERSFSAPPGWKHNCNHFGIGSDLQGERGDENPARKQEEGSVQPRWPAAGVVAASLLHGRQAIGAKLTAGKFMVMSS